jgi:hypothetical protein
MNFKNTTQKAGDVVEITSSMKLRFNSRKVGVKLTKADYALIDAVDNMMHSYISFKTPQIKLMAEIQSDTFRGGLLGKVLNLQEWHDAYSDAYNQALVEYNC